MIDHFLLTRLLEQNGTLCSINKITTTNQTRIFGHALDNYTSMMTF